MLQRAMAAEAEASREARAKVMKTDATLFFWSDISIFKGDCRGRGDESLEGPEGGLADHRAVPSSSAAQIPPGFLFTSFPMQMFWQFMALTFINILWKTRWRILGSVCTTKLAKRAEREIRESQEMAEWLLRESRENSLKIWVRKIKIECSNQTIAEVTDTQTLWLLELLTDLKYWDWADANLVLFAGPV